MTVRFNTVDVDGLEVFGHFALETHGHEIGAAVRDFLAKHLV